MAIPFDELQKQAGKASLTYAEGYPADDSFQPGLIDEAVAVARSADVALLFIALPTYNESEGYDRADLDLTPQQVALIKAVCSVQPRTVVILNNGAAAGDERLDRGAVDNLRGPTTHPLASPAAVLEAWMMGQAGGGAIADVLFGKVNPSGKLAETFPLKLADTPAYINYPGGNGQSALRRRDFHRLPLLRRQRNAGAVPLWLWRELHHLCLQLAKVSAEVFKDVDGLTVSVDVTNTGKVAGKEIVQVYVHDRESGLKRPPKELKGFAKVELQPGETKTVTIPLDFRAFAYYHPAYSQWITEDGEFDILIGASAADIRFVETVTLQSTVELPSVLNRESTINEWLADRRGKVVFDPIWQMMKAQMDKAFGDEDIGLLDLPLLVLLHFQESALPVPADDVVDGLLAQVHGGVD